MAIYVPGKRDRHSKAGKKVRNAVATLSLTAMVDMFTVLTIFLLQNYNSTGEILHIPQNVKLPAASSTKELKPANVVTISNEEVMLNKDIVAKFADVKEQKDWMVSSLYTKLVEAFRDEEVKRKKNLQEKLRDAVEISKENPYKAPDFRKITVQADKSIDFLTVKKIMFTVTEAGATEINFAVIQKKPDQDKKL